MASHQLLYFFVLTSLLFLFISPCHSSSSDNNVTIPSPVNTQKVNLSLYYEPLCFSDAIFIVYDLPNIFETDLINIVNLRLVPWGNAQLGPDNNITCQNGPHECFLNTIQACAINVWPDVKKHFSFIQCVENQTLYTLQTKEVKEAWEMCSEDLGLDKNPIKDCYESGFGKKLSLKYARETSELHPRHEYVPWAVVNQQPLYKVYANFAANVCKAYKGLSPPRACYEKKNPCPPYPQSVCYEGEAADLPSSQFYLRPSPPWRKRPCPPPPPPTKTKH